MFVNAFRLPDHSHWGRTHVWKDAAETKKSLGRSKRRRSLALPYMLRNVVPGCGRVPWQRLTVRAHVTVRTIRSQTTFAFSIITFPSFPTNLDEFCYWQFHSIFTLHRQKFCELLTPTNFFQTLHPSISAWTTHGLPLMTSPNKTTTVLIRRNAPTDSCHNLTALMRRCTKTSFLLTPHNMCSQKFRQPA